MWVVLRTSDARPTWTVGFYDPTGEWHPLYDFNDKDEAGDKAAHLNGGPRPPDNSAHRVDGQGLLR